VTTTKTKPDTNGKLTSADMKAALDAERQERVAKAAEEIQAVCEKYRVAIDPQFALRCGQLVPSIQIFATE